MELGKRSASSIKLSAAKRLASRQMRDFCLFDPSGVLWRIGQNC